MMAVFGAGLWLILHYGAAHLKAREDLAGEWELSPLSGTAGTIQSLHIDQSGEFLTLNFEKGPRIQLKMVEESTATPKLIKLSGNQGEITLTATDQNDQWRLQAVGQAQGGWTANL